MPTTEYDAWATTTCTVKEARSVSGSVSACGRRTVQAATAGGHTPQGLGLCEPRLPLRMSWRRGGRRHHRRCRADGHQGRVPPVSAEFQTRDQAFVAHLWKKKRTHGKPACGASVWVPSSMVHQRGCSTTSVAPIPRCCDYGDPLKGNIRFIFFFLFFYFCVYPYTGTERRTVGSHAGGCGCCFQPIVDGRWRPAGCSSSDGQTRQPTRCYRCNRERFSMDDGV